MPVAPGWPKRNANEDPDVEDLSVPQAAVTDPAAITSAAVVLSNMNDGSANNTLVAIGDTSMGNESDNIEVNFDKLGDEINALVADVTSIRTSLASVISALESAGIIST